jgi:hypothetical protein
MEIHKTKYNKLRQDVWVASSGSDPNRASYCIQSLGPFLDPDLHCESGSMRKKTSPVEKNLEAKKLK